MDQIHRRTGTERLDSQGMDFPYDWVYGINVYNVAEALRRTVASLDDDKWMYEGEDEF